MPGDITFTATAQDPESGDTAVSTPVEADVNVDAVADAVTVDITVNDNPVDDGNQFSPGETGSVKVEASSGDAADGSKTHTVTVHNPDAFLVRALTDPPVREPADSTDAAHLTSTLRSDELSPVYTFPAPATPGLKNGEPPSFNAKT